jgi:hypothetical protein
MLATKTRKLALPAFTALALLAGIGPGRLSLMQPAWAEDSGGGDKGGDHGDSGDHGSADKGGDR